MSLRFLVAIIILSGLSAGAESRHNLTGIKSHAENGAFIVDLNFDSAAPTSGVTTEYINETVQVSIPNGFLKSGTRTNQVNTGKIKSLFTYQSSSEMLRARIILQHGISADSQRDNVAVIPQGNSLRIKILDSSPKTTAEILDAVPVLPTALKTEIAQNLNAEPKVEPVKEMKMEPATQAKVEEEKTPVLNKSKVKSVKSESSWQKIALAMAAVAIFAMIVMFVSKQWARVGRKSLKHNQIKVITQHYLAPRKSLAIIRVAGESILIGITDSAITPIKTLSLLDEELPEETPTNFQKSLRNVEEATEYALPEATTDSVKISSTRGIKAYGPQSTKRSMVENQEDYSIQGIRQLVKEKLKDMRTI